MPVCFDQYPHTPGSCRRRQCLSLPQNTPLVLHPFPKNQKEEVNLPSLNSTKVENKDIPLFFDQCPGTPRSCRIRQHSSFPRSIPLVLHPFPKNQKEGVNLANFSEEKKSRKQRHTIVFCPISWHSSELQETSTLFSSSEYSSCSASIS